MKKNKLRRLKPYKYKTDSKLYKPLKFILKPIYKILYRPKIKNKEAIESLNGKGAIIISNHRYNLDPVPICISTKRVVHFIGKLEIMNTPFVRIFLRHVGIIPVDRTKKAPMVFKAVGEHLKEDRLVALFPEGTRNKEWEKGGLLDFKKGAAIMARENNVPIIIAVQKGKHRIINKDLSIEYSNPIHLETDDHEKNTKFLRDKMLEMLGD